MTEPKLYYSPKEINFTKPQVLWLVRNLSLLKENCWPQEASGYTNMPKIRQKGSHKAYFETCQDFVIEIEIRLERAGIDGLILEATECWGKSVTSLSNYFRMPGWSVWKRRKTALAFVSGWNRKPSYREFRNQGKKLQGAKVGK